MKIEIPPPPVLIRRLPAKNRQYRAEYLCSCGKIFITDYYVMKQRKTKSCGCYRKALYTTHGHSANRKQSTEYRTWVGMHFRCRNKKSSAYRYYGGRGISVCERWFTFEYFLSDMGTKPKGLTLDRIDNNKGYSPENCRWATRSEQQLNKSDTNRFTFEGQVMTLPEMAKISGLSSGCLWYRLKVAGWSVEKAMTTPNSRAKELVALTKARQ